MTVQKHPSPAYYCIILKPYKSVAQVNPLKMRMNRNFYTRDGEAWHNVHGLFPVATVW
jgi:hypothetical protein